MATYKNGIVDTFDIREGSNYALGTVEFLDFEPDPLAVYTTYRTPGRLCAYVVIPCVPPQYNVFSSAAQEQCIEDIKQTFAYLYVVDSSGYKFVPVE
jgi:hypothetical protein